jgi:hypothetical protein
VTILGIRVVGSAACDCEEGGGGPPPGPTVSFDVVEQDYNTAQANYLAGAGGSNYATAYVLIDPYYIWWSSGGFGADPGDFVPELGGLTGVEVVLAATDLTATSVATTTRTALDAVFDVVGGSGTTIEITDALLTGTVTFGLPEVERGAVQQYGSRYTTYGVSGGLFNDTVAQHVTSPAADHLVDAIGIYLQDGAGETVRLGLYVGGSSVSFVGTSLLFETTLVAASGSGWNWAELTDTQAAQLATSSSVWFIAKSESSASARPVFNSAGAVDGRNDFTTSANVSVMDPGTGATQIDPDPTVPFPSTLNGRDVSASYALMIVAGFRLRPPDEGTDAERGAVPGMTP